MLIVNFLNVIIGEEFLVFIFLKDYKCIYLNFYMNEILFISMYIYLFIFIFLYLFCLI